MTHAELVKRAAKWLQQKHSVVVTEIGTSGEEPDAIGFRMGFSTLIECKTSRSDYYADRRKPWHRMGDFKYFMTPKGLLSGLPLTEGWGLLEVCGRVVRKVKSAPQVDEKNWRSEQQLLLSCFRRLGKPKPEACVGVNYYGFGPMPTRMKVRASLGIAHKVTEGSI